MVLKGRARNGEGGITRRKDGRYQASIRLGDKRPTFYGKTERDVLAKLREAKRLAEQGRLVASSGQTVKQYLDEWLESDIHLNVSRSTHASYRSRIRQVNRYIGHHKMAGLKPVHIRSCYRELSVTEGIKSVTMTHMTLNQALTQAVRENIIATNPAAVVRPPRYQSPEVHTLSEVELMTLFRASAHTPLWHPMWVLLGTTGMRVGEALALRWRYVNDGTVCIVRTLDREPGTGAVLKEPKTAQARRTIDITPFCAATLKRHRAWQTEHQRFKAGSLWEDSDLVFTNEVGLAVYRERVQRQLVRALREAELPIIRTHDLRHTFATLMLEKGTPIHKVSQTLGHASITITLETYAHVTGQMDRDAVDRMDQILRTAGLG
jgi:integrase